MGTGADGQHPSTNMFLWQPLAGRVLRAVRRRRLRRHRLRPRVRPRDREPHDRQGRRRPAGQRRRRDGRGVRRLRRARGRERDATSPVPAGSDRYTEGAYATGNGYNGIRDFLAGRPMGGEFPAPGQNPDTDPLNYGDFGFDNVGPEVHADGEIWIAVQIDLRDLFLTRYPSQRDSQRTSPASAARSSRARCPGDRRWIQDYYDAMVIMPRNPTMSRRATRCSRADLARFGGAQPGPALAGLRTARLRPVTRRHDVDGGNAERRHRSDAGLLVAAGEQRDVELLRRQRREHARPGQREDLRRRLPGPRRRRSRTPTRAPNADGTHATGNLDNTAQFVPNTGRPAGVERRTTSSAVAPGFGHGAVQRAGPAAGRDPEHH